MESNYEIKIIEIKCNSENEKLDEFIQKAVQDCVGVKPKTKPLVIPGAKNKID